MAQSSFGGFTQPKKDGGKSPYYSTQQLDENRYKIITQGFNSLLWTNNNSSAFTYANAISIGVDGSIYGISSGYSPTLYKINNLGTAVLTDFTLGTNSGTTNYPTCVHADKFNNIYVGAGNMGTAGGVFKFTTSLGFISSLTDVSNVSFITTDIVGSLYVTYSVGAGAKNVRKLTSSLTEVWSLTDIGSPNCIAVAPSGNIYVTYNQSAGTKNVRKLNSSGSEVWSLTDVGSPRSIAIDKDENIYIAYNGGNGTKILRKLDSNGNEIWSVLGTSTFNNGVKVQVDSLGNIHFGTYGNPLYRRYYDNGQEAQTGVVTGSTSFIDCATYDDFLYIALNGIGIQQRYKSLKIKLN